MARGHRSSRKRLTSWIGMADQLYTPVPSNTKVLIQIFDPFSSAGIPRPTVVRNRGMVSIIPNQSGADLSYGGAFGIGVVTDEAVAAGVASVPGPVTDSDWQGWLAWQSFAYRLDFDTGAGKLLISNDFELDSKGMRKMGDGETLVMVAESQVGAFDIFAGIRTLLMLS